MTYLLLAVIGLCLCTSPAWCMDIDAVLVQKNKEKMYLVANGQKVREYDIILGWNPDGHKQKEGDGRTPEGRYVLDYKKDDSSYYKAIHISYPNARDIARAKREGVDPGGLIMVHGRKNDITRLEWRQRRYKWTNGCIQVTNAAMDEIWDLVQVGTPIEIQP
ncbi:L,D-transpeptidase family protein [Desulfovermiculus halophilus]|jgi:murein L,D-transpeptidase YafK|uniref:L,D-transpeptidase family protein n=1 Tax=Desulfovermiculus halophilus TaxID=339722 RepID=UPI0004850D27|nr:L,D-transpeptidase family protein [Desulfovermiculus halophilus]